MNLPILSAPAARVRPGARFHTAAAKVTPSRDPRLQCQLCCATDASWCATLEGCSCPMPSA